METKQIEVDCPCCQSRLAIDVRTARVLRSRPKGQVDEAGKPKVGEADWTDAFGKVKTREAERDGRLGAMLDEQRRRSDELESRFQAARKKLEGPEPAE